MKNNYLLSLFSYIILIFIVLFPNNLYSQQVFSPIKKDEKSKFDGIVLTIESASKLMSDIKICEEKIENAKLIENKINELKSDIIKNINDEEIKNIKLYYDKEIYNLNKNIESLESTIKILNNEKNDLKIDINKKRKYLKLATYSIIILSSITITEFLYIYYY